MAGVDESNAINLCPSREQVEIGIAAYLEMWRAIAPIEAAQAMRYGICITLPPCADVVTFLQMKDALCDFKAVAYVIDAKEFWRCMEILSADAERGLVRCAFINSADAVSWVKARALALCLEQSRQQELEPESLEHKLFLELSDPESNPIALPNPLPVGNG